MCLIIACGGITAGLKVSIFLTSSGVDIARKRATDMTQVKPLGLLSDLMRGFMTRGENLWACTPCVKSHRFPEVDLVEVMATTGTSRMHELIKAGAATLSY